MSPRSARAQERKVDRMAEHTHGGYAGRSLVEMLRDQMAIAADRYVEAKEYRRPGHVAVAAEDIDKISTARGELRGLARAVCIIESPYAPTRGVKGLEREAVREAREKKNAEEHASA